jgi:hypothetical protein
MYGTKSGARLPGTIEPTWQRKLTRQKSPDPGPGPKFASESISVPQIGQSFEQFSGSTICPRQVPIRVFGSTPRGSRLLRLRRRSCIVSLACWGRDFEDGPAADGPAYQRSPVEVPIGKPGPAARRGLAPSVPSKLCKVVSVSLGVMLKTVPSRLAPPEEVVPYSFSGYPRERKAPRPLGRG